MKEGRMKTDSPTREQVQLRTQLKLYFKKHQKPAQRVLPVWRYALDGMNKAKMAQFSENYFHVETKIRSF